LIPMTVDEHVRNSRVNGMDANVDSSASIGTGC
jgi:hypothetical protein